MKKKTTKSFCTNIAIWKTQLQKHSSLAYRETCLSLSLFHELVCMSTNTVLKKNSDQSPLMCSGLYFFFYAPEGTLGGILKSHRPSVSPSVRYKSCLSNISLTTEANLMKLHRNIQHNEKVCRAHDLGSYTQGRNQVKGQNLVSAITQKLLKQI